MGIFRLEEMTWMELDQLDRKQTVVWIPISPIEEHGPHLPLGTDLFGARDMAESAANLMIDMDDRLQAVLAPAIPLGGCRITADFPGTISIRGATLVHVVFDVCNSFADHDFRYIIIANHHLDPVHMKAILVAIDELKIHNPNVHIIEILSRVHYSGAQTEENKLGRRMGLDMSMEIHADVCETAYIRHRYPELFKPQAEPLPPVLINIKDGLRRGIKTFKQMGANMGYIGSPEAATEALGRLHLEENARHAADFAVKLLRGEAIPEIPLAVKQFFDKHVKFD